MAGGVDRDIQCGADFAQLAELGCFDEEFVLYGCAFYQKGRVRYLISADQKKMTQFYAGSVLKGCFPTPIKQQIRRLPVASGQKEDIKQQLKVELACQLRQIYSPVFFRTLAQLADATANDGAYPLLEAWRQRLEGHFWADETMLFAGACQMALESKVLTEKSYQAFTAWIKYMEKQMADDQLMHDKFMRKFSGFAYQKTDGQLGYFFDAQEANVLTYKSNCQQKAILSTPVLSRSYSFGSLNQLPAVRQDFAALLKEKLGSDYIALVQAIAQLPSAITAESYQQAAQTVAAYCGHEAQQALAMYACRWHLA